MPKMDVTVSLKEGMKIALIEKQDEEYILIKSLQDNEMYLLKNQEILKLSEIENLDTHWICTDLSYFEKEVTVLETENKKLYLMDNNDFCIHSFVSDNLDEDDDNFQSVDMRILKMKLEEYMRKTNKNYYLNCRDVIADFYNKKGVTDGK